MKAIQTVHPTGLDTLRYADIADAKAPGPGEISVRLRASSLNYHDYMVVLGAIPTPEGRIPMSDGAGEVTAVGEGVREFAVGDLVVSTFFPAWLDGVDAPDGGFSGVPGDGADGYAREQVTAPATSFTHAPKGWSAAEAATITCAGVTAWRGLVADGALKGGETVLVQGTGGVSIYGLQIAKAFGCTVIATSSSDEKLERLKALGADHLINYKSEPAWGAAAAKLTGGRGVDHILEIGGSGTLPESINATRNGGHIALIGVLAGYAGPVPTVAIMGKQLKVQGLTVGSRRHQLDMIRAIDVAGYRPVLDKHFPLENLADAFRHQASNTHFGKIVVDI
ncbi:NAD(P)-dependent alcohol dehydrogenase [Phenylobacterium sp. 20VBR1]|uniref:NAD(P)-dependent alcohol dehydrogenase n=1 Tax=Phenylobacterium glaciei TaxID=2803784 RepID=A0A941CZ59_9CAUL|nr:NAD(P)-dependent alcohol dehydrogenase [Phenylobacterium glaciei]MBR7618592.1 NAD(P)-dependent alcohol dehydrogenase [Phenylobacterium glaciei]